MKALTLAVGFTCGALGTLTWIAEPDQLPRGAVPTAVEFAVRDAAPPRSATERIEIVPVSAVPELSPVASAAPEQLQPTPSAPVDVLATARAYFHAQVRCEELFRALPPEVDRNATSRDLYPDYYVAACDELVRLNADFGAIGAPAPSEPLPLINVYATDEGLARTYKGLSREDLLFENWHLARAAHAESKRILDERLEHGPYEATQLNTLISDG